jgi:D-xylose 1-dehydrogenase (NADP+, D-xylono-1,5-lactone-forming)
MMNSLSGPLQIGIFGAAKIARLFVEAVRASAKVQVRAVASRDAERAQTFARDCGVPQVHATYDSLLADSAIHAIYIPLPNNLHAKWSIRAVEAGKHVLCEKPLATSAGDAVAMFAAARRHNVYLVEGYPYRAQPQTLKLRELLARGEVGRIQIIQASFGFPLGDTANIRLDPDLGGGALMDAGSYPASLVRFIAGERPARVQAIARWGESGVDRTLVGSIEFSNGVLAQIACSFATARHRHAIIIGESGSITTSYFNDTSAAFPPILDVRRGSGWDAQQETIQTSAINGFLAEAEAFYDLVAYGWERWTGSTPEESVDTMLMLEALAASARHGNVIDLADHAKILSEGRSS